MTLIESMSRELSCRPSHGHDRHCVISSYGLASIVDTSRPYHNSCSEELLLRLDDAVPLSTGLRVLPGHVIGRNMIQVIERLNLPSPGRAQSLHNLISLDS
jgi:hypothetical protein